jgi:hypothetical protein
MNMKMIALVVYITFMTTLAIKDAEKYGWSIVPLVFCVVAFPAFVGYLAGRESK